MKIVFLLHNAYAIGGTVRSTLNLAGAMAARHEVEIVSVFRSEERPLLGVNRKVRLVPLVDERDDAPTYDGGNPLMARPSTVVPPAEVLAHRYTELTDERLRDFLNGTDADVVVATRPALVVFLARHGSRRYLRVGQEHLSYDNHVPDVRTAQNEALRHLDAFVTVSAQDAADHRDHLPGLRTRITDIPNAAPRPKAERSDVQAPLVVAAGRLMPVKRYDLLIEAFARVVAVRPEWRLRIYGQGPERAALRAAVDAHRLNDHVFLMGAHPTMETEWAKASVAAVSSDWESFGMTILEAMHAGVPVVATDCPHGPGEIITDGSDGLLVPPGDADAFAAGLLKLIEDTDQRRLMGEAARETVQRFAPRRIADQYERLFGELREARTSTTTKVTRRVRRALATLLPQGSRPGPEEAPPAAPPLADDRPRALRPKGGCTTDSTGGVRITVNAAGVSGKDLTLVLRHRHGDDETRVPLERPDDPKSPWTANLSHHRLTLAEGRWDLYVERAEDGTRRRLKAGLVEQRGLLSARPVPGKAFAWWIPYATKDGYLALRTFHRPAHAEATALRTDDDSLSVEGTLHGAVLGEGALLLGVSRDGRPHDFETPATPTGERTFRARITTLPRPTDADKPLWDLFLRPSEAAAPVRVGRITDDIVDRKPTAKHPSTTLTTPTGRSVQAHYFFTITNDVAISAP
ncbi:glycosyltransferase family 4 protein [Streptomyces sp. IB201691-2A2]|uniref:glycosyltransferase family 4 protein n=1 Tax=Streptomyces sp. IB201691-2A2 TaxID=2561920 RepID=UPI00117E0E17|nr:glycosyltransferase family 4 protein [Streptomyces sp. IB201691-2A2]TRO64998.1 glycosyltransferase family 4 protein [Streptomyces sp. IB201691-2A2]